MVEHASIRKCRQRLRVCPFGPDVAFTGRRTERFVIDASTQPPLAVGKQHGNGDPLLVLDAHSDRVAWFAWHFHIGYERCRAD